MPPRTRVAAMLGYPETPRTAWRSSNDLAFIAAADFYNKEHGLQPGDKGFKIPEFLKAWAMRESGGEGNEREFRTDPFQVNNPGDWADEKREIAGLRRGQSMTPAVSADAALRWLRYKSEIRRNGRVVGYSDDEEALRAYNGRRDYSRQSGSVAHKFWYARTIVEMANQASTARK
jgi:hypothetical protein